MASVSPRAHGMKKKGGSALITSARSPPLMLLCCCLLLLLSQPRNSVVCGHTRLTHMPTVKGRLLRSAPDRRLSHTPDLPVCRSCAQNPEMPRARYDGTSYFNVFLSLSRRGWQKLELCFT